MRLNVFCRDLGWLFEDLKGWFKRLAPDGLEVVTSAQPVDADAWLGLRTDEAHKAPDPARTTVQYHDCWAHARTDAELSRYAAAVFTHPDQMERLTREGHVLPGMTMLRPIGAPEGWRAREDLSERFTIGWAGRARDQKKGLPYVLEAARRVAESFPSRLLLLGAGVSGLPGAGLPVLAYEREQMPFSGYEELYRKMDALVIASKTEAGPLPLFEALACGVPVVSSGAGWSRHLIVNGFNGYVMSGGVGGLVAGLQSIATHREAWLARAEAIRASLMGWTLEGWVRDCIEVATA